MPSWMIDKPMEGGACLGRTAFFLNAGFQDLENTG
jgi:hypothetical protein